ncbi:MAG: lysine--tRNA ligase [Bdellovibrionota bacterium]
MTTQGLFWADEIAQSIAAKGDTFVAATGITPSGHIHIGNMREVLTADVVVKALRQLGKDVTFYYIADTFDPLRRVYPFLDQKVFEPHVGKPLSEIPGPGREGQSYAEYFLEPFLESLKALDIHVDLLRADQMYKEGRYVENIIKAMEATPLIREILQKETGKETPEHWSPFQPICQFTGKMTGNMVLGFDPKAQTVHYRNEEGQEGECSMSGGGKLTWRLDWPARWQMLGVRFEPFGKDHASKGGSYDTAIRFAREIFNYEPPYPATYEWISLKGGGDMSSSKGNVLSIAEMVDVIPPEVLKYSVSKVKPSKRIVFDPGLPMLNLIDEFDDPEVKTRNPRAVELSAISGHPPLGVPFKHIVSLIQVTQGDVDKLAQKLNKAGYAVDDMAALKSRAAYATQWLEKFGPEDIKFEIQAKMPPQSFDLSDVQKKALRSLGDQLQESMDASAIHDLIYQIKNDLGIEPGQVFLAIYTALLGKNRGPRAGFFLASLDTDFVKERFLQVAQA